MGTTNSVEAATEEVENVMQMVDRKCNSYMMCVEHTSSVVDVSLSGLRKEIFDLIAPLRDSKHLVDLGMEDMAAMLERVERHANTQKFVVQRLLDIMFQAQANFGEMAESTMANADVDDVPDVLLDEGLMTSMRLVIEDIYVKDFEEELNSKQLTAEMTSRRCDELHRLLFKLAEVTVSEMVEDTVTEMKDAFLEDIDNMICISMMSGDFKQTLGAKECLQQIISKSIIARVSLEALPFSRRVEVESGQDEIEQFVDNLVRKVQMHHSNEETQHFEQLMNLDLEYSDVSSTSSDSDGSDDHVVTMQQQTPSNLKKNAPKVSSGKKTPPKKRDTKKASSKKKSPTPTKKTSSKSVSQTKKRKGSSSEKETEKRVTRSRR